MTKQDPTVRRGRSIVGSQADGNPDGVHGKTEVHGPTESVGSGPPEVDPTVELEVRPETAPESELPETELSDADLVGLYLTGGQLTGGQAADAASPPLTADVDHPDRAVQQIRSIHPEKAFSILVERYSRLVFKIAYSKANDREDAADICQDVFLHVHRSLPRIRDPQAFLGWLMAIAHNRANRYCRTRQSRRRRLDVARDQARIEAARLERSQQGAFEAPEDTVTDAVRELPDEYQNALKWKYVEGLSYEEIGERLDMSFHQVDYVLRKAKRALKQNVEKARQHERTAGDPPN